VAVLVYQFILMLRGRRTKHVFAGLLALVIVFLIAVFAGLKLAPHAERYSKTMKRSVPERDITAHEAAIIEWLLDHAAMRDVTAYRKNPITALRVVSGCDCGCSSLDFHSNVSGPKTILADAVAVYPDKQQAGLILWGRDDENVMLEVYEMHPVANRVPEIADLRRYEDLFAGP